jgi:hypothetical protein
MNNVSKKKRWAIIEFTPSSMASIPATGFIFTDYGPEDWTKTDFVSGAREYFKRVDFWIVLLWTNGVSRFCYLGFELIPHTKPDLLTKLRANDDFITHACNAYETAVTTLQQIANYGDLSKGSNGHPLMVQLSSEDCAELASTALDTISRRPTTTIAIP